VRALDCTRVDGSLKSSRPPSIVAHRQPVPVHLRISTLTILAAAAFPSQRVLAQRQTHTNTNAWFVFNADVAVSEEWAVLFDASARRSGTFDEAMANFVRGGLAYEITDNVRAAVGANWSRTYPYGELPSDYPVTERRIWQQLQLSHDIGRLGLSHRYRLEQRFRGRRDDPEVDHIDHWERSNRFRYQVKGTLPLSGDAIEQGEAYVSLANELFVGIGRNVQRNIFDQNRATFSVGYRLTRNWRTEVGFLEHVIFKPNGTDVERNHTVTFTLSYSRPHLRPIGVTPSR
jgi:hypothetical protein